MRPPARKRASAAAPVIPWSDLMGAAISLRYTRESYDVAGGTPASISANGIGIIVSLHVRP